MMLRFQCWRSVFLPLFAVIAVSGGGLASCTRATLTTQAMAFNKTVGDHRVQQLFLNVIRAAHYEPMAITSVSSLQTTNKREIGVNDFSWKMGPLSVGPFGAALGGSASNTPTMTLNILDEDPKFTSGFMRPVSPGVIKYFLAEGWNEEFLAFLLIERIEGLQGTSSIWVNDPRKAQSPEFISFRDGIEEMVGHLGTIKVSEGNSGTKVTKKKQVEGNVETWIETTEEASPPSSWEMKIEGGEPASAKLVLRSPQGILYYLGELARIQIESGSDADIPEIHHSHPRGTEPGEKLFLVRKGPGRRGEVSVAHRGRTYHIPDSPPNRSMVALSFVQQLVNLQAKDVAPAPAVLQVVGN
ncbi:MAG: hypothetical protein AB7I98_20970 [Verrucomicrobiales bacterium]|nr:hypothetical protein [Verrucomicrobiae bacterium]MCP5555876.1 hypothetical protein [Akkermansiaceae bacterium]